ncbi:MAG: hypothetical protein IKJ65_07315 [Clostridia bacterium]|nr:hypothetical protein [Clostridia bacterium]
MAIELNGSKVSVSFSEDNGALLALSDVKTGWEFAGGGEALSFELGIPKPHFPGNTVKGFKTKPAWIEKSDNEIEIRWDGVTDEDGEALDIAFTGKIRLTDGGCEFSGEVENRSEYMIEHVAFPCFGKINRPLDAEGMNLLFSAYSGAFDVPLYPSFTTMSGYWSTVNPVKFTMSPESAYALIRSGDQGVCLMRHDANPDYQISYFSYLMPHMRDTHTGRYDGVLDKDGNPPYVNLAAYHMVFVPASGKKTLSTISLEPYEGSWQAGVMQYRQFYEKAFSPAPVPKWAQEIRGWYQLQMASYGYGVRYRYKDLPEIGRELVKNGVTVMQLTGWTKEGMDGSLPSHDVDPRMGTYEELKDAIRQLEEMGVRVVLYCKFVFGDMRSEWYQKELYKHTSKDIYGVDHCFNGYAYDRPAMIMGANTHRLAVMCMNDKRWRDVCLNEVKKFIELGASGLLFDETFNHGGNEYCFDPSHGHPVPASEYVGDVLFAKEMRALAREMGKEDFLLAGEALPALYRPYYDLSYFRFFGNTMADYRYVDSKYPMVCVARALEDRSPLNFCLLFRCLISYEPKQFKGRIGEFPELLKYGHMIDALRKRYQDRLWEVEFIPTEENAPKNAAVLVSEMKSTVSGLKTIVLVNLTEQEQTLENPYMADWAKVTPENPDIRTAADTLHLLPLSAIVLLEPKAS